MIDWLRKAPLEPEIDLGGRTLPIVLRRLRHAKRLTLRLAPDGGEVRITSAAWAESSEGRSAFAHARAVGFEKPSFCPLCRKRGARRCQGGKVQLPLCGRGDCGLTSGINSTRHRPAA